MSRSGLLTWLDLLEDAGEDVADIPPLHVLWEPDILDKAWGWQRLLPYEPGFIEWPKFKEYLQEYFKQNADQVAALIMNNKPDFYVRGIPSNFSALHAAADLCCRSEAKLQSGPITLSDQDIQLSMAIVKHAESILDSGDVSFLATYGFVCIMKEAELMCQLPQSKVDITNFMRFSNQIRRSVLNLMLQNVDKFTAVPAAAAMMGLAREAKIVRYVLTREDHKHYLDYDVCDMIREGTAEVLAKLEEEFAHGTAAKTSKEDNLSGNTSQI